MKSSLNGIVRQRLAALLVAGSACLALSSAHAAAGNAGTRDYAAEDKLLGGPSTSAGYADPYGQAPDANGKGARNGAKANTATTSAETMMNNNADPAQTNASFVAPGSVVMKRSARVQNANGKLAAAPENGANGVKMTRKPLEIYKSPY